MVNNISHPKPKIHTFHIIWPLIKMQDVLTWGTTCKEDLLVSSS